MMEWRVLWKERVWSMLGKKGRRGETEGTRKSWKKANGKYNNFI